MIDDGKAPVVVAGLFCRFEFAGAQSTLRDDPIGGPVVLAAIGVRCTGVPVNIIAALPAEMTDGEREIFSAVDPEGKFVERLHLPALVWRGPGSWGPMEVGH